MACSINLPFYLEKKKKKKKMKMKIERERKKERERERQREAERDRDRDRNGHVWAETKIRSPFVDLQVLWTGGDRRTPTIA